MILELHHYKQEKGSFACGPTSLKIVFEFYGKKCSSADLIKECNTLPGKGTTHSKLKEITRKKGFKIISGNGSINKIIYYINRGFPVIVNYINPKSKRGHYSVIKGYTKDFKKFIFSDPSNGSNFKMNIDDFEKAWHNSKNTSKHWFLVVKP